MFLLYKIKAALSNQETRFQKATIENCYSNCSYQLQVECQKIIPVELHFKHLFIKGFYALLNEREDIWKEEVELIIL